jgi:dihydrofolate synthase / folylpolyglutamate synthase
MKGSGLPSRGQALRRGVRPRASGSGPGLRGQAPSRDYHDTLSYLYGLQYRGIKYGLKNIRALLAACGNPHRHFIAIHVAGTNGKGSTSSFLASIMQEAGYRTGLYTSPHLVNFTERIKINGGEIPEARLVDYAREMRGAIEKNKATFFEATTCIAFRYFADEGIDVGIIETGLGGRLDATNVLTPVVSVITNIAMDHMEYLGNTIAAIAREKAGIIKPRVPVVTASASSDALRVIRSVARHRRSPFHHVWDVVDARVSGSYRGSSIVRLQAGRWKLSAVRLGHPGAHQVTNASLAVCAAAVAVECGQLSNVHQQHVERGLRNVVANTGLEGRMQTLTYKGIPVLLDVAHNPDGAGVLANSLTAGHRKFPVVVFGIVKDKDAVGVLTELRRVAEKIIAVTPKTERGRPSSEITRIATEMGILAVDASDVAGGMKLAMKELAALPKSARKLLIGGSHYVVGEAMPLLRHKEG